MIGGLSINMLGNIGKADAMCAPNGRKYPWSFQSRRHLSARSAYDVYMHHVSYLHYVYQFPSWMSFFEEIVRITQA